jgi:AcrR family transcriptional regulator
MSDQLTPLIAAMPAASFCPGWDEEPAGLSDVARRRRDEIMDAAEAIIAGEGIDELSLKKIETRAGMSRGQLTYYFPTRESILLAVYERMLRRMIRERFTGGGPQPMTGRAWDCFRHALVGHLGLDSDHLPEKKKDLYSLLYTFLARMGHREDYRDRLSEMYRGWRELIAADVAHSVPELSAVPPQVAASMILALLHGLTVQLMVDPEAFDRQAMNDACERLFGPVFREQQSGDRSRGTGDRDQESEKPAPLSSLTPVPCPLSPEEGA